MTQRITIFRVLPAFSLILLTALAPSDSFAYDNRYGPPIEVGGGLSFLKAYNKPDWSSSSYTVAHLDASLRFFKGLSIHTGIETSFDENPSDDMLFDSEDSELYKQIEETFYDTSFLGLRYDLPMSVLKKDYFLINSLYTSVGISWARYEIATTEWSTVQQTLVDENFTVSRIANLSGPYAILAARWRLDDTESEESDSWLNVYGIDIGFKYTRYSDCSPKMAGIEKSDPGFSVFQIYIAGFLKINMFQ